MLTGFYENSPLEISPLGKVPPEVRATLGLRLLGIGLLGLRPLIPNPNPQGGLFRKALTAGMLLP